MRTHTAEPSRRRSGPLTEAEGDLIGSAERVRAARLAADAAMQAYIKELAAYRAQFEPETYMRPPDVIEREFYMLHTRLGIPLDSSEALDHSRRMY